MKSKLDIVCAAGWESAIRDALDEILLELRPRPTERKTASDLRSERNDLEKSDEAEQTRDRILASVVQRPVSAVRLP